MTDKPTTSAEMNIKEYAEQSYKGAALPTKVIRKDTYKA